MQALHDCYLQILNRVTLPDEHDPLAEPLPVDSLGLGAVVTLAGDAASIYRDAAEGGALMLTTRSPTWQPPERIAPMHRLHMRSTPAADQRPCS